MLAKKLKSRRGMSILMGLLLMLVCMTAGAAALTAAASNAGRYTHLRRDQQRYLAVSSAVRLVRDELCAGEYSASATLTEIEAYEPRRTAEGKVVWRRDPDGCSCVVEPLQPGTGVYSGALGTWLRDGLTERFQHQEIPGEWWGRTYNPAQTNPYTGAIDDSPMTGLQVKVERKGSGEELMSQVKWELAMDSDYNLTANFWLEEDGVKYYETRLTIPASKEVTGPVEEPVTSSRREDKTVTTLTVKVTWPEAGAVIRQM